jgi:hypothetical protein
MAAFANQSAVDGAGRLGRFHTPDGREIFDALNSELSYVSTPKQRALSKVECVRSHDKERTYEYLPNVFDVSPPACLFRMRFTDAQ